MTYNYFHEPRIDLSKDDLLAELLNQTPEAFIRILANEMKAYALAINDYAVLTEEDENIEGITISGWSTSSGKEATVQEVMSWIIKNTRSIEKLSAIALNYADKTNINKKTD